MNNEEIIDGSIHDIFYHLVPEYMPDLRPFFTDVPRNCIIYEPCIIFKIQYVNRRMPQDKEFLVKLATPLNKRMPEHERKVLRNSIKEDELSKFIKLVKSAFVKADLKVDTSRLEEVMRRRLLEDTGITCLNHRKHQRINAALEVEIRSASTTPDSKEYHATFAHGPATMIYRNMKGYVDLNFIEDQCSRITVPVGRKGEHPRWVLDCRDIIHKYNNMKKGVVLSNEYSDVFLNQILRIFEAVLLGGIGKIISDEGFVKNQITSSNIAALQNLFQVYMMVLSLNYRNQGEKPSKSLILDGAHSSVYFADITEVQFCNRYIFFPSISQLHDLRTGGERIANIVGVVGIKTIMTKNIESAIKSEDILGLPIISVCSDIPRS